MENANLKVNSMLTQIELITSKLNYFYWHLLLQSLFRCNYMIKIISKKYLIIVQVDYNIFIYVIKTGIIKK
jgi:hypothetical protein